MINESMATTLRHLRDGTLPNDPTTLKIDTAVQQGYAIHDANHFAGILTVPTMQGIKALEYFDVMTERANAQQQGGLEL